MGRKTHFDETTDVTHHDEGVSFEVTLQHGSSSDRVRVKAKLKSPSTEAFVAEREGFLTQVRQGAEEALEDHQEVFHDDEDDE